MSEGWICLHRKLRDWRWYHDSQMVHLWIHLLLEASHEPIQFGKTTLERGQCITGQHSLSESTGLSRSTIRTCLNRLKSTNEITIKSTNQFSIITILNYSGYQNANFPIDQQINQQPNQQSTSQTEKINHIQQRSNNITNKRSPLYSPLKKNSIPEEKLKELLNDPELAAGDLKWLRRQYDTMADHFARTQKKDWTATFRNWLRNARYRYNDPPHANGSKPAPDSDFEALLAKHLEDTDEHQN